MTRRTVPGWVSETIHLLAKGTDDWRTRLLAHLLVIERGVSLIALRLAQGQEGGSTGQPRPAASAVTQPGISALADKAGATQLRALDQGTATAI